jgi:Protein of unknown function (DUF3237)
MRTHARTIRRAFVAIICGGAILAAAIAAASAGPATSVESEYLMTLYVPIADAHDVDDRLRVIDHPNGWVDGPRIKGKIIPPSSDVLRNMGSGVNRLDVRLTIQTDDDQIIFVSYNGVSYCQKEARDRLLRGDMLRTSDCYFITAPTFETKSERYAWLNSVQAVGKMLEFKRGEDAHLLYDIFIMK